MLGMIRGIGKSMNGNRMEAETGRRIAPSADIVGTDEAKYDEL